MPTPLVLTFAELEFLLASCPPPVEAVRTRLRLDPGGPSEGVVAAGLASLVVRGLCATDHRDPGNPDAITLQPELVGVAAALASSTTRTSALGWSGDQPSITHFFDTPELRLAFRPGTHGRFAIDLGDGSEPLAKVVNAFVDWCARDGGTAAVVVQSTTAPASGADATTGDEPSGERTVGFAVALEPDGTWYLSDEADSPDRGVPMSRAAIRRRIAALLDTAPAQPHAGA